MSEEVEELLDRIVEQIRYGGDMSDEYEVGESEGEYEVAAESEGDSPDVEEAEALEGPEATESALRSIKDIIADLSAPIKKEHIHQRKQGGSMLSYIPWHTAVRYLDYFAPGWNYSIVSVTQVDDKLVLVARIEIPCAEGIVYREATGIESLKTSSYGDPASNSESMALRRAAAKFGLGLGFYSGDY